MISKSIDRQIIGISNIYKVSRKKNNKKLYFYVTAAKGSKM